MRQSLGALAGCGLVLSTVLAGAKPIANPWRPSQMDPSVKVQAVPQGQILVTPLDDGKTVVLASSNAERRVQFLFWDVDAQRARRTIVLPYETRKGSLYYSPRVSTDGRWAWRHTRTHLELYSLETDAPAAPAGTYRMPKGASWVYAFDAQRDIMAVYISSGLYPKKRTIKPKVTFLRAPNLKVLRTVKLPKIGKISSMRFAPDGTLTAVGRREVKPRRGWSELPQVLMRIDTKGPTQKVALPKDAFAQIFATGETAVFLGTGGDPKTVELREMDLKTVRWRGVPLSKMVPGRDPQIWVAREGAGAYYVRDKRTGAALGILRRTVDVYKYKVRSFTEVLLSPHPRLVVLAKHRGALGVIDLTRFLKARAKTLASRGRCKGDCLNGVGTLQRGKEVLSGTFVHGILDGDGAWKRADGSVETGRFVNGKLHGPGLRTFADGRRVTGDFVRGKCPSVGVVRWPDGRVYRGHMGACQPGAGVGVMIHKSGERWSGSWAAGKPDGRIIRIDKLRTRLQPYYYRNGRRYTPKQKRQASRTRKIKRSRSRSRGPKITCKLCYGTGTRVVGAVKEYQPPTSLIMAGDKNWGGKYTHYKHKATPLRPGKWVKVRSAYRVRCNYCSGKGWYYR